MKLFGGSGKEHREDLQITDNVVVIWSRMVDPDTDKLSAKLGMEVKGSQIITTGGSYDPDVDPLKFYPDSIKEIIDEKGIPRAIVGVAIKITDNSDWDGIEKNFKLPPQRTREEVIKALRNFALKYNTKFFDIPESEIAPTS